MPFVIEPEVAGGLGSGTVMDASVHPPRVEKLVYEFAGWLGDDLLESFPCYVVSEHLARSITAAGLTGVVLDQVTIAPPADPARRPSRPLPAFRWLRVVGGRDIDDFWLQDDLRLAVSERAMVVLRGHCLDHADTSPLAPDDGGTPDA